MLSFTVPDISSTVTKLMALGAELDGPIKYEIHGKVWYLHPTTSIYDRARSWFPCNICYSVIFIFMQVAALRCIDGHMLGLYEPAWRTDSTMHPLRSHLIACGLLIYVCLVLVERRCFDMANDSVCNILMLRVFREVGCQCVANCLPYSGAVKAWSTFSHNLLCLWSYELGRSQLHP